MSPNTVSVSSTGRSREADVGRVGQRVVKVAGEAVLGVDACVGNPCLLVEVRLRAVRFVGYAHDISAVAQKRQLFGELLDGRQVYAAAPPATESLLQLLA